MIAASLPVTPRSHGFQRWSSFLSRLFVARSSVDWVQVPEALEHAPSARARRLMRNARCGGW